MSVFSGSALLRRALIGTSLAVGLGAATLQPAPAQARTLSVLADVPAFAPAPYHPQAATAAYSAVLYSGGIHSAKDAMEKMAAGV